MAADTTVANSTRTGASDVICDAGFMALILSRFARVKNLAATVVKSGLFTKQAVVRTSRFAYQRYVTAAMTDDTGSSLNYRDTPQVTKILGHNDAIGNAAVAAAFPETAVKQSSPRLKRSMSNGRESGIPMLLWAATAG
jgi:hypothetical protein